MTSQLRISEGQYSSSGRKPLNQDFHGIRIPADAGLSLRGIAVAIADGISSSSVSQIASETAVRNFLDDYYCTPDAWSVKKSAMRVLGAVNTWLHSQTLASPHRYDKDRGYVCTFSGLVFKSRFAHIFHVGDTRVYRLDARGLEQLTKDHRLWATREQSYLSRALGIEDGCEIDYLHLRLNRGDIFILATDGIHEWVDAAGLVSAIETHPQDLAAAASAIAGQALRAGSGDNLTIQIIRIEDLPPAEISEVQHKLDELPLPPVLDARMQFDGYRILRELHASPRSHVYLAMDEQSRQQVVIKTPSIDLGGNPAYLERFLNEEWVARRLDSAHVLKAPPQDRDRNFLYTVFEFIEGQTLAQWITDNPAPTMEVVRDLVEQVARGLLAFHRMDMLYQDLKPDNIMIDRQGTVKIIDFGTVRVAGLVELREEDTRQSLPGTALYAAPEYFLGAGGTARSDLFSLGVLTYYLLSGRFPYGTRVARCKTGAAQRRLQYRPVLDDDREIPLWVDEAIRKAVHINPGSRYAELSEFLYDLRHPNKSFLDKARPPLLERDPAAFWRGVSLLLALFIVFLLSRT